MKKYKLLLCGTVLLMGCLLLVGCSNPDFYGQNVSRSTSGISAEEAESTASYSPDDFTPQEQAAVEAIKVLQEGLRHPETTVIYKITYIKNSNNTDLLDIYIDFDAINENGLRERMVAGVLGDDPTSIHESLPTFLDLETTIHDIDKVFAEANRQLGIRPDPSSSDDTASVQS